MEVNAYVLLLVSSSVLYSTLFAEASNVNRIQSMVHSQTIRRNIDTSIVNSFLTTKGLIQCSYICMRRLSTSLYFDEIQQKCHCNSEVDTSTEYDVTQPEMIYGTFGRITKVSLMFKLTRRQNTKHEHLVLSSSSVVRHNSVVSYFKRQILIELSC